jgi:hypothetical protein
MLPPSLSALQTDHIDTTDTEPTNGTDLADRDALAVLAGRPRPAGPPSRPRSARSSSAPGRGRGRTDLNNLTLLCRYRHHNFASKGWDCQLNPDGIPEMVTTLVDRPIPHPTEQHPHPRHSRRTTAPTSVVAHA